MRKAIVLCSALIIGLCTASSVALAAPAPEKILEQIISKIKEASNASPVVDYVDWDEAFSKVPEQQRTVMSITSPEQMKSFYTEVLKNPSAMMQKQFEARLKTLPEEQRGVLRQSLGKMQDVMKKKEAEMKERIAKTEYKVGKSTVEGDKAKVELSQTFNGETKTEEVKFVKKDGKWLLPSVGIVSENPKSKPSAEKLKAMKERMAKQAEMLKGDMKKDLEAGKAAMEKAAAGSEGMEMKSMEKKAMEDAAPAGQ